MNDLLFNKAKKTVEKLSLKNITISVAESCTGGMVSEYLTSVPGVSEIYELGITSYSCRIKNKILGVDNLTLNSYGAISEQTASEMAVNIRKLSDSDIGLSVTGAAGPDGSEGHLPGLVFIALSDNHDVIVKKLQIEPQGRNFVREAAVSQIFDLINNYLEGYKNETFNG